MVIIHDSILVGRNHQINLISLKGWKFSPEDNPEFSSVNYDDNTWKVIEEPLNEVKDLPESWEGFGWFRIKIKIDSSLVDRHFLIGADNSGGLELYINDSLILKHGNPSPLKSEEKLFGSVFNSGTPVLLEKGATYQLAIKYSFHNHKFLQGFSNTSSPWDFFIAVLKTKDVGNVVAINQGFAIVFASSSILLFLVMMLHFFLYRKSKDEVGNFWVFLFCLVLFTSTALTTLGGAFNFPNFWIDSMRQTIMYLMINTTIGLVPLVAHKVLTVSPGKFWIYFTSYPLLVLMVNFIFPEFWTTQVYNFLVNLIVLFIAIGGGIIAVKKAKKHNRRDLYFIAGPLLAFPLIYIVGTVIFSALKVKNTVLELSLIFLVVNIIPLGLSVYQARRFLRMHKHLDHIVSERTRDLEKAYKDLETSMNDLKAAQTQLVQQEKLASLGQLTAGIAHEIKNPLNFVTNFSDVCLEMVEEAKTELNAAKTSPIPAGERNGDFTLLNNLSEILKTIELNLKKILQHGNRADGIVKSMLLHSRGGTGKKEAVDFNSFVKEYVNLSFHGMRASKRPINVKILFDLDEEINKVPLIAEDFSRVILNLCNNAFDAMREHTSDSTFHPVLKVSTKKEENKVHLSIKDNGRGIDPAIADHILQPFFTTKKGTDGTGLGLSLSNEIVKAHGGEIRIESQPGEGANFIVIIPI